MPYVLTSAMGHPVGAYPLAILEIRRYLSVKKITHSFPISWNFYTFAADFTYSTQGVPKV